MIANVAGQAADAVRPSGTWEVFGQRLRRFEVYLAGAQVEMTRGPLVLEGVGLRVIAPSDGHLTSGFQATTDLSPASLAATLESARRSAADSRSPGTVAHLPTGSGERSGEGVCDPALWSDPAGALDRYRAALLAPFEGLTDVRLSFGSIRATLAETSIVNSEGLDVRCGATHVDVEVAVQAFGGPEGRAPGEYWVNLVSRRLDPSPLKGQVETWARYARDVRRSERPPSGDVPVLFPPDALADILPAVVSSRLSGQARLRGLAPEIGAKLAAPDLRVLDDGARPWGHFTAPFDDEGTPASRRTLIEGGATTALIYDVLDGAAFDGSSTGNGHRGDSPVGWDWRSFLGRPVSSTSTVVVAPGTGGTLDELAERAGDGLLVVQLGFPIPDAVTTVFGGELRLGYRIRGGKIAGPVRGGTVGGPGLAAPGQPSLLANVTGIGSHAELAGELDAPPLLVGSFTVAGA